MKNLEIMTAILQKIKEYDRIMLFRHVRPDGDCVGATKGLKRIIQKTWPEKEVYLIDEDTAQYLEFMGPEDEPVADDPTALVLMPGIAFDKEGHRIGYGGGFYDKFLAKEPNHPTVALCYDFQIVKELPTEEFDVPVDLVLWA